MSMQIKIEVGHGFHLWASGSDLRGSAHGRLLAVFKISVTASNTPALAQVQRSHADRNIACLSAARRAAKYPRRDDRRPGPPAVSANLATRATGYRTIALTSWQAAPSQRSRAFSSMEATDYSTCSSGGKQRHEKKRKRRKNVGEGVKKRKLAHRDKG